jgi:AcrR family transcriptional regulator
MPLPVRVPSSRAQQAEHTRTLILQAAQDLFAQHGYDATSLQMIAERLDITKSAVTYHFGTKDNILLTLIASVLPRIEQLFDQVAQLPDLEARPQAFVPEFVDLMVAHRVIAVVAAAEHAAVRRCGIEEHPAKVKLFDGTVGLRALFGDHSTPRQRLAFWTLMRLALVLPEVVDLDDETLRETLLQLALRLLDPADRYRA